jgi:hypothetical protein
MTPYVPEKNVEVLQQRNLPPPPHTFTGISIIMLMYIVMKANCINLRCFRVECDMIM